VPEAETRRREAEDDDVDMIPLIDVSLVLLIFFILTSAVSSMSPIDVPAIKSGMEFSDDKDALTVQIDLRDNGEAYFALQVGTGAIERDNNNLDTINELRARLDAVLSNAAAVPEARIAANKKVKHARVQEVMTLLDEFRRRSLISVYRAEVSELPK
jgi:biopolymer transport protein ExbD